VFIDATVNNVVILQSTLPNNNAVELTY